MPNKQVENKHTFTLLNHAHNSTNFAGKAVAKIAAPFVTKERLHEMLNAESIRLPSYLRAL